MSFEQEKKVCQKHSLEITTIDLKQSTVKEEKYLCTKCLIEKIDIQNMTLIDETKIMIQEMKNEQQTLKIKNSQKRIENFKQIQNLIQEFKVQVDNGVEKVLITIQQKIQVIEKDLEQQDSQYKVYKFEDEVEVLSQYQKSRFHDKIPFDIDTLEDDSNLYESLYQTFESFKNNQSFTQVIDSLQKNKQVQNQMELKSSTIQNQKEADKSKTPTLDIKCKKHGKEIIMLNLDPKQSQIQRQICVDCIHENDPIKYTSLQDASLKWDEFQDQTQEKVRSFQNQRLTQIEKLIQNLKEMREQQTQILTELINKCNKEKQSIQQLQLNQLNLSCIFKFTEKQIDELTQILSQQDKFKALRDQHKNMEKEDQINLNIVNNNLNILFEFEILKRQDILNITKQDQNETNMTLIEDQQIKNIQAQEMNEIMRKIQNFNIYSNIFNQELNLYQSIMENIEQQKVTRNKGLKQIEDTIAQINIEINDKYEEVTKQFLNDTVYINKILSIDKLQEEIKLNQQQIAQIIHEKEILQSEKNQIQQNFEKVYADQINKNSQIINLDKLLKDKDNHIDQINKEFYKTKELLIQLQIDCQDISYLQKQISLLSLKQQEEYSQNLTFSEQFKHKDFKISQNGKFLECNTTTTYNYGCCLCDQMIPKKGLYQFAFKIIELSNIMIGVCYKDIIEKTNFQGNYGIGKGSYSIRYCGNCWNHNQEGTNGKNVSFKYGVNDIIKVEVDMEKKSITWSKEYTNQSFQLQLDTAMELYPCIHLEGKNKIEILK